MESRLDPRGSCHVNRSSMPPSALDARAAGRPVLPLRVARAFVWVGSSLAILLMVTPPSRLAPAGERGPTAETAERGTRWPLFRGDPQMRGVAECALPEKPALLWQFAVKNGAFEGTAAIADGVAYIGDMDGELHALALSDGSKKWEFATDSSFIASPSVRNGRVYLGDVDGRFVCLDAATGKPLWSFEAQAEIDGCANFLGARIVFGSQDATLYCLEQDSGKLVWKHAIDDQIRCAPTLIEGHAFVAGCDSRLHIIDASTGTEKASVDIQSPTGVTPAAEGDRVYFGTEAGTFFAIDWRKAEVVWTFSASDQSQAFRSSPALANGRVFFGGRDKRLHALDAHSGKELWAHVAKTRIDASPVVVGDRVFFGSGDGRLTAVDARDGRVAWEHEVRGGFTGSPAVAADRLVIASDAGVVYCFGAADKP